MRDLPTGTVTFLFTDIEGSTKLLYELGPEGYERALADHRRALRDAFVRHGGVEVDTQGDAFFVAFADSTEALAAAQEAQRAVAAGPIRVRMGLHSGTPRLGAQGYVGHDVHLGARIAAAGHGGQVLISGATMRAMAGEPDITDLGEHRLKDFAEAIPIYQLGAERFPPLKTISNTNLPRPASSFVGRDREVDEITALLRDGARLLTLTGPGGTGKTRLSIEAAAELVPEFKAGVFWVPLASLRDPALVTATIGQTIGAKDGLAEHIGEREMLLLIDNLEQVIEAAPELAELVETCPNLRLLTTSRELLRVRGEMEYAVPPLADSEAVELFAARSGLPADDTIERLCRRLENLPLAVELAAARARVLSPAQILERLSGRLDLLKGGRDADPRQQTLRAAIEWSYDLLSDNEKEMFSRFAVFGGGATLEAAEKVVDADIDTLQALVDKSLVRHSGDRFWMLETIREFAAERLEASGEADVVRRRHGEFFLALAEAAEPHLRSARPEEWLERLDPESDNIRAALDQFEAIAAEDGALRLSSALDEFWCPRSEESEGRSHLEAALSIGGRPTPARAKALIAAAHLARDHGDPDAGEKHAEEALALTKDLGDNHGAGRALLWLGASIADQGDFLRARPIFDEAARLLTEVADRENALFATRLLAWMYYELGDRPRARALHESNLARARELGTRDLEASILGALSEYAVDDGRIVDAVALAADGIRIEVDRGSRPGIAIALCKCANALHAAGQVGVAVQVLASSAAWYHESGGKPLPYLAELNDRILASSRGRLSEEQFDAEWAAGEGLSLEKAAAIAIETLEDATDVADAATRIQLSADA